MRPLNDRSPLARHARRGFLRTAGWLKHVGAATAGLLFAVSFVSMPAPIRLATLQDCAAIEASSCFTNPNIDLAVVLDHSGSLTASAFNIQVDGLASALRDPTVIPRDGSVGLSVITFADSATVQIHLATIRAAGDAQALAAKVEALRCAGEGDCPTGGTLPASNFGQAIRAARLQLKRIRNEDGKPIARRVLLLSTDGECTDGPDCGQQAAAEFKSCADVPSQFNVVLIGGCKANCKVKPGCTTDSLVALGSCAEQSGATRVIGVNGCAAGQAACDDATAGPVAEYANNLRCVLRRHVKPQVLQVTNLTDPVGGPTAPAGGLSLRQAIEMANANGGETTITFKHQENQSPQVIALNAPLPPICAPGVTVDGCAIAATFSGCCSAAANSAPAQDQPCTPLITIDGGNRFCDGLLIRSNRAHIHGLALVNFTRAAITIAALGPQDHVGFNRIDGNRFGNTQGKISPAGMLVLDPSPNPANAVAHNERNTIVGNTFTGCATPIDLNRDGPTANDAGDGDSGPNALLNFPRIDAVEGSPASALIRGTVDGADTNGQPDDGSLPLPARRIDVYAVTEFDPSTAAADARPAADRWPDDPRRIISVIPLAHTDAGADGSFAVAVGASPTCGYVVTATDRLGNTSELSFPCRGFAKARLSAASLDFGRTRAGAAALTQHLTLENVGCDSLRWRSASVIRITDQERLAQTDDEAHFSLDGSDVRTEVLPGQQRSLEVKFLPSIPRVITPGQSISAAQVLPRRVIDLLTFVYDGGESPIPLTGRVKPEVRLINPDATQQPPLVKLTRAGDSFFVEFSVYDSNLNDIDRAEVVFFDAAHRPVPIKAGDERIALAPILRGLVPGQSFRVVPEFISAKQHPETRSVQVQVFDKSSKASDPVTATLSATVPASATSRKTSGRSTRSRPVPLRRGLTRLKTD
ncbi:MAG: vWA domain-containing protein [Blastocatellia bacterium]